MGTKSNPGKFDCYAKAEEDEPMFTLLARDLNAPYAVEHWAERRKAEIEVGSKPPSDMAIVEEALQLATEMRAWRRARRRGKGEVGKGGGAMTARDQLVGEIANAFQQQNAWLNYSRALALAEIAAEIAVEACAEVCDYGVKWEPPLEPPLGGMSRETARLLAKAIRRMLEKEPGR